MKLLVTGGAGFIGSNFIIDWYKNSKVPIINLDKLTYASNKENLNDVNIPSDLYSLIEGDICDGKLVKKIFEENEISSVINFAAESHVDRSINDPELFIKTNVIGTYRLLQASLDYFKENPNNDFRFLHVSTDEVYGDLEKNDPSFTEDNQFKPNSPYSASKASSDHLVRAFNKTYNLPTIISNCSNNYGPYQFPEKLIPLTIKNAISNKSIGLYGDGSQIRDWLYVSDHCSALRKILDKGEIGQTYNIGGDSEKTNLEVVLKICSILDNLIPRDDKTSYSELITYIKDRPGHDKRYAINSSRLKNNLGWSPCEEFDSGIYKTVHWYLKNSNWLSKNQSTNLEGWLKQHYNEND